MRRKRILLVAVAVLGVLFALGIVTMLEEMSRHEVRWDGGYKLTVHVESQGQPMPIRVVSCEAFGGERQDAEEVLEYTLTYGRPDRRTHSTVADSYDGHPLQVEVAVSGRSTRLTNRELSRSQFNLLVVVVTYADGTKAGKVVEIPDGRVYREVRVTFP